LENAIVRAEAPPAAEPMLDENVNGGQANHPEPEIDAIRLAVAIPEILEQMASDFMQKLGNPRRGRGLPFASYGGLTQYERVQLSFQDLNTLKLDTLFNQIQWRRATEQEWTFIFRIIFPPAGYVVPVSMRHLATCNYYIRYLGIINDTRITAEQGKMVTDEIHRTLNTLAWLPDVGHDRLWNYAFSTAYTGSPHATIGGPRLLLNPNVCGEPTMEDNLRADILALREEDEESDEENAPTAGAQLNLNTGRQTESPPPPVPQVPEVDEVDAAGVRLDTNTGSQAENPPAPVPQVQELDDDWEDMYL
jgi:hypothetical protein